MDHMDHVDHVTTMSPRQVHVKVHVTTSPVENFRDVRSVWSRSLSVWFDASWWREFNSELVPSCQVRLPNLQSDSHTWHLIFTRGKPILTRGGTTVFLIFGSFLICLTRMVLNLFPKQILQKIQKHIVLHVFFVFFVKYVFELFDEN